jgi:hypothetical protein
MSEAFQLWLLPFPKFAMLLPQPMLVFQSLHLSGLGPLCLPPLPPLRYQSQQ